MSKLTIVAILLVTLSACSDQQADDEHVWKDQTDTIEKARDIEQLMIDAADQQRQHVEQESR